MSTRDLSYAVAHISSSNLSVHDVKNNNSTHVYSLDVTRDIPRKFRITVINLDEYVSSLYSIIIHYN